MNDIATGTLCAPKPELEGEIYCEPKGIIFKRIVIFRHHKLVFLYTADREYPKLRYFILGTQIVGLIDGEFDVL